MTFNGGGKAKEPFHPLIHQPNSISILSISFVWFISFWWNEEKKLNWYYNSNLYEADSYLVIINESTLLRERKQCDWMLISDGFPLNANKGSAVLLRRQQFVSWNESNAAEEEEEEQAAHQAAPAARQVQQHKTKLFFSRQSERKVGLCVCWWVVVGQPTSRLNSIEFQFYFNSIPLIHSNYFYNSSWINSFTLFLLFYFNFGMKWVVLFDERELAFISLSLQSKTTIEWRVAHLAAALTSSFHFINSIQRFS